MSPPAYFPLRWESTGDHWWYASPIDWAAANGHYDLVRELLRLDANHLIQLTSLRRIRRLETVWDDDEHFHDVASCRSQVARKLLSECEIKKGKNSLIGGGYGGWLLYTASSAGDMDFVRELLERDPLLVFGEGEYGVTDILYAAARSKSSEVFKLVLDFAASPRFAVGEEQTAEIPSAYRLEIMNRAIHAAARGGNLGLMKELLRDCSDDALAYRDIQGATVLHAAAARGQVEVVRDLASSSSPGMMEATDNEGNTALHVAAHRGHLAVVEALISASPSSVTATNNAGDTFLHAVVSGFQSPGFRRLDRQIELMKRLLSGKPFPIHEIINAQNQQGRTALHLAIMGNIHTHLVDLLMSVPCIHLNIGDTAGMTPLDILRQRPQSASSELLISAGGIFSSQDYSARRVIASHIKRQSMGSSPGTSFRVSDVEIFLYTGLENGSDGLLSSSYSPEVIQQQQHVVATPSSKSGGGAPVKYAERLIKRLLPKTRKAGCRGGAQVAVAVPVPLRQRYVTQNKSSSQASPIPSGKKRRTHGHGSRSSSFSKLSFSSHSSLESEEATATSGPKSKRSSFHRNNNNNNKKNKRVNQYLCFGGPSHPPAAAAELQPYDLYERSVLSAA